MKYQICVSGGASGATVKESHALAFNLGKAIAEAGQSLVTGATVGLPHYAAMGFKSVNQPKGIVAGFSPASSHLEHVQSYQLPTAEFDYIHFTGMAYVGRDTQLVRSSDALLLVGGRMGSVHELATALESRKVCGVLVSSGGLADFLPKLLESVETPQAQEVIFESEPVVLVQKVLAKLEANFQARN